jgi:aerobic carbon-monoxide dehydrogenase medium subunit
VKPAPFQYVKPVSVADALIVLDDHPGEARLLAGGQSLVPMLGMRLLRPEFVVDINGLVDELGGIRMIGGELVIGALVRYVELEQSPLVTEHLPLLQTVVRYVGDRQVRNRGTLGGAVAQADPTGEAALACLVLGADVVVRSRAGDRTIGVEELFLGSYWTALEPGELLTHVRFPRAGAHCTFFERGRKHNDFAVVSVAVVADRDADGAWHRVRIGLGGAADTPILVREAMAALEGRRWDVAVIDRAAELAIQACDPPDDARAGADYRRHLVGVHVRRALLRLSGGSDG